MVSNSKKALYNKFMTDLEQRDPKKERYENLRNDSSNTVYVNGAPVKKEDAKKLLL